VHPHLKHLYEFLLERCVSLVESRVVGGLLDGGGFIVSLEP
jgi:hypothetical protein